MQQIQQLRAQMVERKLVDGGVLGRRSGLANLERRWNGVPKTKHEILNVSQKTIHNCLTVLRRMLSIARKRV